MPDGYAYPPRAMAEREAARYCGLSASTFRRQVPVPPRLLSTGRVGWLREELDAWLDARPRALTGLPPIPETPPRDDADIRALAERLAAPKRPSGRRATAR